MPIGAFISLIKKSVDDLKKNLIVLVPDALQLVLFVVCGYIILKATGILNLLFELKKIDDPFQVRQLVSANLSSFGVATIIAVVVFFFISCFCTGMLFSMVKQVIVKKKSSLQEGLKGGAAFFWRIAAVKLVMALYVALVTFCGLILLVLLSFVGKIIGAILGGLLIIVVYFFIIVAFFYRYPALFRHEKTGMQAMKDAFTFFKKDKKFVIVTAAIIYLMFTGVNILTQLLQSAFGQVVGVTVSVVLGIMISTWSALFLYHAYLESGKKSSKG